MTLTRRLLLLGLISVLPAIVIWAFTEVSLRRAREAEVNEAVIRQAQLAASELDHIFNGINGLLLAMDETPSIRSFNVPACTSYLRSVQQKVPHIIAFAAIDLEGAVRCNSTGRIDPNLRLVDRPYFRDTLEKKNFSIGTYTAEFTEGGLETRASLPLALPIWGDDGQMIGVLAAALDLKWLDQKLKERVIPNGGSLTIADRNGVIISREPLSDRFVGTRIPDLFLHYLTEPHAGSFQAKSQDGTTRIIGYIPVSQPPRNIYVSAGLSTTVAFAAINEAAKRGFMLIAAALILALSLSWLASRSFITKPFEIMTNAVTDWRRGDYQARIHLPKNSGEFGLLAKAFNDLMDDVAERQEALKASEERARLALEAGHMGTWWYDHRKHVGGWSSQATQLFGLRASKPTTAHVEEWKALLHAEDAERAIEKLRAAVLGDGEYDDEYRIRRPDGQLRWISSKGKVSFDAHGKPQFFVGIIQDITERKEADEQQRFFLDELNHRVKNTLATVQSIASQTLRASQSAAQFKAAFEGRLLALSMTHNLLTRTSWREADLHDIAEQELAPYRRDNDERVVISGPKVNLPSRYAINIGLVLHELVTNAVKYGALSVPTGRLELAWTVVGAENGPLQLRLRWSETGGPPVQPPKRQGFGSRLIRRSIEGELDGRMELDFAETGVSYDICVPLP